MARWILAGMVMVAMSAPTAWAHKSKRTDPCGCHHEYGLRHCHPNQKKETCEAPVEAQRPHPHARKKDEKKDPPANPGAVTNVQL